MSRESGEARQRTIKAINEAVKRMFSKSVHYGELSKSRLQITIGFFSYSPDGKAYFVRDELNLDRLLKDLE